MLSIWVHITMFMRTNHCGNNIKKKGNKNATYINCIHIYIKGMKKNIVIHV